MSSPDASHEVVLRVDDSLGTVILFGPYKAMGSRGAAGRDRKYLKHKQSAIALVKLQ